MFVNRSGHICSRVEATYTNKYSAQYKSRQHCSETWAHASDGVDEVVVDVRFPLSNHFPADRWRRRWRDEKLFVTLRRLQVLVVGVARLYRRLHNTHTVMSINYKYNAVRCTTQMAGRCPIKLLLSLGIWAPAKSMVPGVHMRTHPEWHVDWFCRFRKALTVVTDR